MRGIRSDDGFVIGRISATTLFLLTLTGMLLSVLAVGTGLGLGELVRDVADILSTATGHTEAEPNHPA